MHDRELRVIDRLVMWHLTWHRLDWCDYREVPSAALAAELGIEDQTAGRALRALLVGQYLEKLPHSAPRAFRLRARPASATPGEFRDTSDHRLAQPLVQGACIPPVVAQALEDRSLTPAQRLSMWYLPTHFLCDQEFRPVKAAALALLMGVEVQTAGRAVRALLAEGYLNVHPADSRRGRRYRLPWTRCTRARAA